MGKQAKFTRLLTALVKRPKSKAKRKAFFRFCNKEFLLRTELLLKDKEKFKVLFGGIHVLFQKIIPAIYTEYQDFSLLVCFTCTYSFHDVNIALWMLRTGLLETTFDVFLDIPTKFRDPSTVDAMCICVTILLEEPRTKYRLKEYHRYEELQSVISEVVTSSTNQNDLMKYRELFYRTADCWACGASEIEHLEFKKCGGCKLILYCSQECQEQDWENHGKECKKLHYR